jgi:hypothetical protein
MHRVLVEGVALPKRIGGHPALDFCNTWANWGAPPAPNREWLSEYETFALWTAYAELIDSTDLARCRGADAPSLPRHADKTAEKLASRQAPQLLQWDSHQDGRGWLR